MKLIDRQCVSKRRLKFGDRAPGSAAFPNRAVPKAVHWKSLVGKRERVCCAVVVIGATLSATSALRAEHARIDLSVSRKGKEVTASADREPPAGGRNEPPVLKVTVNEPLVFQFFLTNTYPHGVIEHVRVRYYVARVGQLGRKPSSFLNWPGPDDNSQPPLQDGVVTEGQFFMDFKPDCRVGARLKLKISKPGYYSARVETLNTQSDHEHFSAIDLVVE
jgi:hypothetical protein